MTFFEKLCCYKFTKKEDCFENNPATKKTSHLCKGSVLRLSTKVLILISAIFCFEWILNFYSSVKCLDII